MDISLSTAGTGAWWKRHAVHNPGMDSSAVVHDRTVAALVFATLLAVYLLTFSGQFRSIDEYAMYARVESLAQGQGLATPQLQFTERHHPVGSLEPGQPLLATPLYLLGKIIPGASSVASVMLFSALTTALTGAILYLLADHAGLGQVAAVLTALAWGIGTTAWPYARSFFREPLLALCWALGALLCLRWQQTGRRRYAIICLLVIAATAAVKISSIGAAPVFALALLWDPARQRLRLTRRSLLLLLAGLALAAGAAMVLYRLRYGGAFPLARYTWEYPWGHALLVAYGLLISPVKGLLFFSPILVATLPGWRSLARRSGTLVFLSLGLTAALLYTYGAAPQWHGGSVVWGPRFAVPLLPLLMLPYGAALGDRRWPVRAWVILWTIVGLTVQISAGTASWSDAVWQLVPAYVDETLVGLNGIPWWSWRLLPNSPALVQLTGWAPRQLDMLWLRTLADGSLAMDRPLGALLLVSALASALALALRLQGNSGRRLRKAALAGSAVLVTLALAMLLVRSGRDTNDFYGLSRAEAAELARVVSAPAGNEHRLLYVSNDFFTYPWLGLIKGRVLIAWNSPHYEDALRDAARSAATSGADRLWLVIDRVHAQADIDPAAPRQAMAREAYEVDGLWVGGYELLAYAPQAPMHQVTGNAVWENGLRLSALAVSTTVPVSGDTLLLDLTLSTERALPDDLTLFTHLVPAEGPVLAGRDGPPGYGGTPTSAWAPGVIVTERRAIPIPGDVAPGAYVLTVGWLDAQGRPVPVPDEGGACTEAALATIEIVSAP